MHRPSRIAAIAVLVFLFGVNVYRAASQSITHDEALTYLFFISGEFRNIFTINDPNNHLLMTLMMRLSTALFGLSDLSMRLPSLAACGLYFYTVFQFSALLFGGGLLFLLSVVLLAANPLVLDFFVAARGYGPALAFLFFGVYCLFLYRTRERYNWRGLYLGALTLCFGVMSNLSVFLPAFVIASLFLLTLPPPPAPRKPSKRYREPEPPPPERAEEWVRFLAPVCLLAVVFFVAMPVTASDPGKFYHGGHGIVHSLDSLARGAFRHNDGVCGLNPDTVALGWWRNLLAFAVVPAVMIGGLIAGARGRRGPAPEIALLWSSAIVVGAMALHVAGRLLAKIPYPSDRTGLYFYPFAGLTLVLLVSYVREHGRWLRVTGAPLAALGCLVAVQYVVQLNWTHFYMWAYDADSKKIVRTLMSIQARTGKPVDVGASWQLGPSLNFYRDAWKLHWLKPFIRSRTVGEHEYYVLIQNDRALLKERNLEILFEGDISGTVLARRPPIY